MILLSLPAWAATRSCTGSVSVGTFRLLVSPPKGGPALPVREINTLGPGEKLKYEPASSQPDAKSKAEIAVVLVPAGSTSGKDLLILDPTRVAKPAEWAITKNISVVALIYGPQGLSMHKVRNLVDKNEDLLSELADYAQQTSKVEGLITAIQQSEQSGSSLNAALAGFSSQYGVGVPKLDTKASTDQQATTLMQALLPSLKSYDPLAPSRAAVMQQSAGLAASVASLFFGNPVGLAAGGALLFQNMRTLMFPGTDFRSAFAQMTPGDGLALCAKIEPAKSRSKLAYLWAHRVPELAEPKVALAGTVNLPIGSQSLLRVSAPPAAVKNLSRARDWRLVSATAAFPVPVTATPAGDALNVDLTKSKAAPGTYQLAAKWDWNDLSVPGQVNLHTYPDFSGVRLTAASQDRLSEGSGRVTVELAGADFEFLEKMALEKAGKRQENPQPLEFTLPQGKRAGVQDSVSTEIDTNALGRGEFRLLLTQSDHLTHEVPFRILPPNPKLADLPLRVNLGQPQQRIRLHGTGLDRVTAVLTAAGNVKLLPAAGAGERDALFQIASAAQKGTDYPVQLKVEGMQAPLPVPGAIEVAGPRPRITASRKSTTQDGGVALSAEEVPAGAELSFALSVEHLDPGAPVSVAVDCAADSGLRRKLTLAAGDSTPEGRLSVAGEGLLFLSLDPGKVGQAGCKLAATVREPDTGASDPFLLGTVVRVPRIEQFTLTDEKAGENLYVGILKGRDLDTIEKAGWDAHTGLPVQSIPTPLPAAPGSPQSQMLKIALPWPAPAPHAPVFVWLRGEANGRATGVKY